MKDTIIVANPGTGKTWEIVNRVMELLRQGVRGEDIVCVTFTNKAADEMKGRIIKEANSQPDLYDEALNIEASTIHGYARGYLREKGIKTEIAKNTVLRYIVYERLKELGTFQYGDNYLISDIVPKIENGIRYLKSFGIVPSNIDRNAVSKIMTENSGNSRSAKLSGKAIDLLVRDFIDIFGTYEGFKSGEESMDFDDLLRVFIEKMEEKHKKYVLVDEFQDLNRMQVEIVGKLAEKRFFVGDRKQSIFGFQGGSLSSFNRYLTDSEFDIRGKNINRRSTNNILNYASSYFLAHSRDDYARKEIEGLKNPDKGEGEKVTLISSANPESDAVALLQHFLAEDENEQRDFAIIVRTNPQILKIAEHLEGLGIKYSSTIKNKVNQAQINDVLAYISGLVSDDPRVISRALLTPFSGLSLKEALEANKAINVGQLETVKLPASFRDLRELHFGTALIEQAFDKVILPIATSIGSGYLNSARSALESAREYLSTFHDYTLEGYLDYMTLSSEETDSELRKARVNILTVHKAKGLEFNTVIYVPSEFPNRLEYFDTLTYAIILSSTGIDVKQDLLEEPLRIDFVALTRPKEKLAIVASSKLVPRFQLQNNYYEESSVDAQFETVKSARYDEAYMMFVNGRYQEARTLLSESDQWLLKSIRDYFSNVSRLSFTTLSTINDPYEFLRRYILKIKESSQFAERGTSFHEIAQSYANGSLDKGTIPEQIAKDFSNFELALEQLKPDYKVPPSYSELQIELPLTALFPQNGIPDNIMINGAIDAVFTGQGNSGKYLIADYKTTRNVKSEHWQQLWLYTRLYQRKFGVSPENISGGIIYVGLGESINTGESSLDVQIREYGGIKTDVVERRLKEFLLYIDRPEAFVENLTGKSPRTELDSRLKEILERII